jgi:hypothetical protein
MICGGRLVVITTILEISSSSSYERSALGNTGASSRENWMKKM